MIKKILIVVFCLEGLLLSCNRDYTPKPRGYFRVDLPEKKYKLYESPCTYEFEYPQYALIENNPLFASEPCWINIVFPSFKAKIHLTYKPVNNNLPQLTEDVRTFAYKHISKADDINEELISIPERKVFGIEYLITGNTASSVNFYLTDSTSNFLSGALYFSTTPNIDSLAPFIRYFKTDIKHLIETLEWK